MLVDTNVLIDVLEDDPVWADWSLSALRRQAQVHRLIINPVIYAELSFAFSTMEALDEVLHTLALPLQPLPKPALFLAGKAFAQYRKRGGTKHSVLADFFIGAHAAIEGVPVLTRDPRRYRTAFPRLRLVTPSGTAPYGAKP